MKKREQGILTVEASIVLTLMLLFILFLFSFGRVYRAQSLVSHATLQTADAVALESYLRETALSGDADDVVYLASNITQSNAISAESMESLRSANLPKIAKQKFVAAIGSSEAVADAKLKSMGIKDGLVGVDFSECKMDLTNDDVIVAIKYTIEMQFPVFGFNEITVTKAAKAKTFGEILFEVSTKPNHPGWGTTSGDDKVMHGSNVVITATPNYGYKFVGWSDGATENPRTVTVNDAQNYVAVFEKEKFGINLNVGITYDKTCAGIAHTGYGTTTGAGNYSYLDNAVISAIPSANYQFVGWDDNGDGIIDNRNATRTIKVDKTYSFKAIFKPALYTVSVKANNAAYGSAQVSQGAKKGSSIQVEYGSNVQLYAASKDSVKYVFSKWSNNSTQSPTTVTVKNNVSYEAIFILNTYTVTFYNGNTKVHSTNVIRGSSINGSKGTTGATMPGSTPTKSGASFDKWKCNGNAFTSSTIVNNNISVYSSWKYTVTLNANGGAISGLSSKSYTVYEGGSFNFSNYTPKRNGYTFTGWYSGSSKYSGNKSISSNVTVNASWSCNHKYDDGTTMLYNENTVGDGGCGNCEITVKCKGCTYSDTKKTVGACQWGANCGVDHTYTWTGVCTGTPRVKHYWGSFRCITCKHCGTCKSKRRSDSYGSLLGDADRANYEYVAGSGAKLCGKHNGKNMPEYKKVVNDKSHK